MLRSALTLITALTLLALTGCLETRLDGPNHGADGPPWIREGMPKTVAPIDVERRIVLIGDTGLYLESDPVLESLARWTTEGVPSHVVFLGDNLYDEGLQDEDRERGERILRQQIEATPARQLFIPGNHDWGLSPDGQDPRAITNQQEFLLGFDHVDFAPRDGCMGPTTIELPSGASGKAVVLVALDPTRWLYPSLSSGCPTDETKEGFLAELDRTLTTHADDWVIVGTHYPIDTGGPHGGLSYGPVVDILVFYYAWRYGGLGNNYEPNYVDWIHQMAPVLRKNPPLAFAAGHDHSLQVLDGKGLAAVQVVSGAGAVERVSTVTHLPETIFAHAAPGFVVLDVGKRGDDEVAVLRVVESGDESLFEMEIASHPSVPAGDASPELPADEPAAAAEEELRAE